MRYLSAETAVRISRIGLGTWQFGSREWGYGSSYAEQDARAIVRRALELGVTLFDTAEIYGFGRSERILGQALGEDRDSAFLATKILPLLPVAPVVEQRAVASANRLGVRRLDLYQVHQPNPLVRDGTIMRGMRALQRVGLVSEVGVSNYSLDRWRAAETALGSRVLSNQVQYSLVTRSPEQDLLPFAEETGHVVIAYSPLAQGLLSGRYDRQEREDLRGQEGRLPVLAKGLAQDPLAAAETVDLSRVKQVHAQLQRPVHDGVRLLLGVGQPVAPVPGAELPSAEPDPGQPGLRVGLDHQVTHGLSQAGRAGLRAGFAR